VLSFLAVVMQNTWLGGYQVCCSSRDGVPGSIPPKGKPFFEKQTKPS